MMMTIHQMVTGRLWRAMVPIDLITIIFWLGAESIVENKVQL